MEYLIIAAVIAYLFRDVLLDILDAIIGAARRRRSGSRKSTFVDERGYERFADSGKSVHRWAAKKKLGRELYPGEVVHHKNRDKLDNSRENLHVFPNQEAHDRAHKIDAMRHGKKVSYQGFDRSKGKKNFQ